MNRRTEGQLAKQPILAALSPPLPKFEGWRGHFEELAAIREHDGGMSRVDAEAGALADCVARWRALNPLPASGEGACVHCGKARGPIRQCSRARPRVAAPGMLGAMNETCQQQGGSARARAAGGCWLTP